MSKTHVAHTKPLSRMQSLSESRGGSKATKPNFSKINGAKPLGTHAVNSKLQMEIK